MFMRMILGSTMLFSALWGMQVSSGKWEKGETFSEYLEERNISTSQVLPMIAPEDKKYLTEIRSNYNYYELLDENGTLLQSLIPISEEMQIHLFKEEGKSTYGFDIIPIAYRTKEYFGRFTIQNNPYTDAIEATNYPKVAKRLSMALKGTIDTRRLQKGDEIAFTYKQKTRLGRLFAMPSIEMARLKQRKGEKYIYVDEDGTGYLEIGKKVAYTVTGKKKVTYTRRVSSGKGKRFGMPLRHPRITSSFSYRRWHPILHRYRPHHGTDFGAKRGTPLLAVNDGKVIFAGWMGGYGKVVKIRHAGGYVSLYAHQSRIRVKRGQRVKKGQIIGYVGNTGRSTGPHLHFGLMKNGRWINPMHVLRKKSVGSSSVVKKFTKYEKVQETKYKTVEIKGAKEKRERLDAYLLKETPSYIWEKSRFEDKLYTLKALDDV